MTAVVHLGESAGLPKRLLAYGVDLVIIYLYIFALFFASTALNSLWPFHHWMADSYVIRHLVAFGTLTLPTLLYFILMERSARQGTFGKSVFKLCVVGSDGAPASPAALISRNVFKFLPWEISHTHLHLNPMFIVTGDTTMLGWTIGIALPCVLVLIYIVMIALQKNHRSLYELASGTCVVKQSPPHPKP